MRHAVLRGASVRRPRAWCAPRRAYNAKSRRPPHHAPAPCSYASQDKRGKLPQWVLQFMPDAHINLTTDMAVHVRGGARGGRGSAGDRMARAAARTAQRCEARRQIGGLLEADVC